MSHSTKTISDLVAPDRIMVIGSGGAGKTVFAQQLHLQTGIPLIHLDQFYWQPDWTPTAREEWQHKVQQLIANERWIMDGNYGGTMEMRMERAQMIIFLDRPGWLSTFRVIKRVCQHYGKSRHDMGENCKEKFSLEFLRYVWNYNRTRKPQILKKLQNIEKEIVILTNQKQIDAFLKQMKLRFVEKKNADAVR